MRAFHNRLKSGNFRLRGETPSRVDSFSDVVFGFALTLLVVSVQVPKTFSQLHLLLADFVPFALSFLLLMVIWFAHYKFFRRYGLEDTATIWINGVLLFFVLFYVYPLKFLFSSAFNGGQGIEEYYQLRELTLLYGVGFTIIYGLLGCLYLNAFRLRVDLEMTETEIKLTKLFLCSEITTAGIGILSGIVALLLPASKAPLATFVYMLIVVPKSILGRKIRKLNA